MKYLYCTIISAVSNSYSLMTFYNKKEKHNNCNRNSYMS